MTQQLMNESFAEAARVLEEMMDARGTHQQDLANEYEIHSSNYLAYRDMFIREETQGE